MKRITSVALAIFFCVSVLSVISFADPSPAMSINKVEAEAGNDVVVEISVTDNPGIGMLKLCIGYDSTKLQIAEKAVNTGLINGLFEQSQTTEKNPYVLVWINTSDSTDDGVIATIKFHVIDTAPSCTVPITLDISDAYKADEESLSFTVENGSVKINGTWEENGSDHDTSSDSDAEDTNSSVDSSVNGDTSLNNGGSDEIEHSPVTEENVEKTNVTIAVLTISALAVICIIIAIILARKNKSKRN